MDAVYILAGWMVSRSCFQPCNPESMEQRRAAKLRRSAKPSSTTGEKWRANRQTRDTGRGQQRDTTGLSSTTQDGDDYSFKNL